MDLPTINVLARGPTSDTLTLDISEHQALFMMVEADGTEDQFWHHVLWCRLRDPMSSTRWITSSPDGSLGIDDLSHEVRLVPLVRNSTFPMECRPLLAFGPALSQENLMYLRARAARMNELMSPDAPIPQQPGVGSEAAWLFADPAYSKFGVAVPAAFLSNPCHVRLEDGVGIVKVCDPDFDSDFCGWTFVERVPHRELVNWRLEKTQGAGRDRRLLPALPPVSTSTDLRPTRRLFKDAWQQMDSEAVPHPMFQGTSAISEICASIVQSGMEPPGWAAEFFRVSGINTRSTLAISYGHAVGVIWYFVCEDGADPCHFAAMEHLGRWILQIQRAVRKNPKAPDFDGLDEYMRHVNVGAGNVYAPKFDRYMADTMKTQGAFAKAERLNREEAVALARKGAKSGKKKDDDT